jgi:hypothetical protein
MRFREIVTEQRSDWVERFAELGIQDAEDYFYNWMHRGQFKLSNDQMDRYEAAFYLIRSVLPDSVIQSYGRLPVMYRGMRFPKQTLQKLNHGGIPIKSKIMAWTQYKKNASSYAFHGSGLILKHQPQQQEVVLSLNKETINFLHLPQKYWIANPGETILSLPILNITPEMVDQIIQ